MSKDLDKELDKDRANKIEDSGDRGLKDIDETLDISSVLEELEAEETKRRLRMIRVTLLREKKKPRKNELLERQKLRKKS